MNQSAGNPSPVPRGRRGTATRIPPTPSRIHAEASAQEPAPNSLMRAKPPRDAGAAGRALHRGRGNRISAFVSSGWVATSAALILIVATAAFVRFVGLSQIGFNSDEAVYSGQAASIAGFQPYGQLFGVFRAHPLMVQFMVALGYALSGHVSDWLPRAVTASFGVGLALICWGIGMVLRGRFLGFAMGMIAALC